MYLIAAEVFDWFTRHPEQALVCTSNKGVRLILHENISRSSVIIDAMRCTTFGVHAAERALQYLHSVGLDIKIENDFLSVVYRRG